MQTVTNRHPAEMTFPGHTFGTPTLAGKDRWPDDPHRTPQPVLGHHSSSFHGQKTTGAAVAER